MWRAHDGMGWWMVWGSVVWLLFWVALVVLVARLLTGARPRPPDRGDPDPLAIAERRYAAGELTQEEFREIRDELLGSRRGGAG